VRFGVFIVTGRFPGQADADALRRSIEAVEAAERAGFDDAWFAEHHFLPYGVCPSAVTLAAHALGRTRSIGIGTAVSVLSTTHPVALAEQWAMLDAVAGGRFRLGVGRGGPWQDLEVFGTGLSRYENGFEESLDLLLLAMRGAEVGARGAHFSFRDVPMVPRVEPRERPPVVVACGGADSGALRLAAERGLPMLLGMHAGDDAKRAAVEKYGVPGVSHISTVLCQVADDRASAVRQVRETLPGWLKAGFEAHVTVDGRPGPGRDPVGYTEMLCGIHPVGSPEYCVDVLRRSARRTGVSHVINLVEATGAPESTLANIERIGAEVLPALRASSP
jgi:alkanesulfonate monooxygenase SsuD/methylene tetrahydromethanopterin reductase-like flavin-dependent oxidoreductase (luciferase family)